jgi:hypothetical protein
LSEFISDNSGSVITISKLSENITNSFSGSQAPAWNRYWVQGSALLRSRQFRHCHFYGQAEPGVQVRPQAGAWGRNRD